MDIYINNMNNYILGMRLEATDFQRGNILLDINNTSLEKDFTNSCTLYNYDYKILRMDKSVMYEGYNLGQNKMLLFRDHLKKYRIFYDKVLLSDIFDVVVLKPNLFDFIQDDKLYVGDESNKLNIDFIYWDSQALLRCQLFNSWYNDNKDKTLLNTGLIAGNINLVIELLDKVCDLILRYCKNYDEGNDMFILNYVCYEYYNDILVHGKPFNTEFKKFDLNNKECYLAHK